MALWSLQGKKILVIDDYAEMRSMLRNLLSSYGADDVTPAATGEEAIELMDNKTFDIVLCDYNLGDGKDGQQVLEEVKLRDRLPYSSLFIMVTAESTSFMVMGALEHQPDEYLSKPVTRTVLQTRLKKLMDKKDELKALTKLLDKNKKAAAITLCDELIESYKRYRYELLRLKSKLLIEEEHYEEAKQLCESALGEREVQWAIFDLGRIAFLLNDYQGAKQKFEHVLQENASFISAYDWLSKTYLKLNDLDKAEQALLDGVERSPKSLIRQRTLADVAEDNDDMKVAEQARKKAIRLGKNSIIREAADFTKLANVLTKNSNPKEALRYLDQAIHEFKNDPKAKLLTAITTSKVYKESGQEKKGQQALEEALSMYKHAPNLADSSVALDLTEACLSLGHEEQANQILDSVIHNNHDNDEVIARAQSIFKQAGLEEGAQELVANVRKEMVRINNQGVKLINEGHIEESIGYFEQALDSAPQNTFLNINTAQAYLMKMKRDGKEVTLLNKARACLNIASNDEKLKDRYAVLNKLYSDIANS